jgi:hypothetical protein
MTRPETLCGFFFRCWPDCLDHRSAPVIQLAAARKLQHWLWGRYDIVWNGLSHHKPGALAGLESGPCVDLCLLCRDRCDHRGRAHFLPAAYEGTFAFGSWFPPGGVGRRGRGSILPVVSGKPDRPPSRHPVAAGNSRALGCHLLSRSLGSSRELRQMAASYDGRRWINLADRDVPARNASR